MINQASAGYPKTELQEKLDNEEGGDHDVATSNINVESVVAVTWRG